MLSLSPHLEYGLNKAKPRLPRQGWLDLTYRCNFKCRHCWVRIPDNKANQQGELSLNEIENIAKDARNWGCSFWAISGGEPMLRPDFADIFDRLTQKPFSYSLNTNGSLITPVIAKLLARRGNKLIALYGADAQVQDAITRHPGSFELTMRGMRYLKEAGAGFTVQIIPMRDNYHQFAGMIELAKSLSPSYRIGAAWLYLAANRAVGRNAEIKRQRLPVSAVNIIDPAIPSCGPAPVCLSTSMNQSAKSPGAHYIFDDCVMQSRQYHIDPYGRMSFCPAIKDPAARFSLREYSFAQIWDEALPAYARQIAATDEYQQNCGICTLKSNCHWCGAYAWLETGRTSAPVPYLCEIARERQKHEIAWYNHNRRFFSLAGMTIQVDSDLPFRDDSFENKFNDFYINSVGEDALHISHHYELPDPSLWAGGHLVYDKSPWMIYHKSSSWIYLGIGRRKKNPEIRTVALFNSDHSTAHIYHSNDDMIRRTRFSSLTALPSDYIMFAHALADHQGMVMHSSGMILHGQGYLFVGPSGAGKSTILKLLHEYGDVLCDDRVIVRKWSSGYMLHGTWSHGEIPLTANQQAPLRAIFLLKKARLCKIEAIADPKQIFLELLRRVSRPIQTAGWIDKMLSNVTALAAEVPVYRLSFTRDKRILQALETLTGPLKPVDRQWPVEFEQAWEAMAESRKTVVRQERPESLHE